MVTTAPDVSGRHLDLPTFVEAVKLLSLPGRAVPQSSSMCTMGSRNQLQRARIPCRGRCSSTEHVVGTSTELPMMDFCRDAGSTSCRTIAIADGNGNGAIGTNCYSIHTYHPRRNCFRFRTSVVHTSAERRNLAAQP